MALGVVGREVKNKYLICHQGEFLLKLWPENLVKFNRKAVDARRLIGVHMSNRVTQFSRSDGRVQLGSQVRGDSG